MFTPLVIIYAFKMVYIIFKIKNPTFSYVFFEKFNVTETKLCEIPRNFTVPKNRAHYRIYREVSQGFPYMTGRTSR
jgi:hypothetical protein